MRRLKLGSVLALCTLLCACSLGEPASGNVISDNIINTSGSASDGTGSVISSETLAGEDAPSLHEGMVRSRLTNEWIDEAAADLRPIAVMIPNESNALPHYSISNASVLYEANVEGRMTRLLAIFEDWKDLDKTGNIRSLRSYFAYWAFEWDAFIVHSGQPFFVNELLALPDTETINENSSPDAGAFFRDSSRQRPHNLYATGQGILDALNEKGYSLTYRGLSDEQHFQFADSKTPNTLEQYGTSAVAATYIDMSGCYPVTRCYFDYNPQDGLYYRSQHLSGGTDGPHMDAATGKQLAFKNLLVQNVQGEDIGEGYLSVDCLDTTQDGWFFTEGRGIHVTWKKLSDYGATRFYDDSGTEISLNTGKTMICIIQSGDNFTFR